MRNTKKGFTLIELLIVVVIVGILALAAIPLITANTRDARRAEGEQMCGSLKNQARVAFAKTGSVDVLVGAPTSAAGGGANVGTTELVGKYFEAQNDVGGAADAATGRTIIVDATAVTTDGTGTLTFTMSGGDGTFAWTSP